MQTFSGECVCGPWVGQKLAHTSKVKTLLRNIPGAEPVVIGEYKLNDYGQWHWWPTEEYSAANILFGPARS